MKQLKLKPLALALTGVFSIYAQAYAADTIETSTVEVVGSTPLATLGVPINEVPSNVQIGSSKDIKQQQALNLADYLQNNLGSVNISNGTGNPYQPDIEYRGFTASPQLGQPAGLSVFFDGVRVNEPLGDIVNWDLIPTNAIAGINLMPGSNPLFGLNTLGGAIAVTTKNGIDFPGLSATVIGGSWGTRNLQAEGGGVDQAHNLDYYASGNFYHSDGWREGTSSNVNQIFSKVRWHNDANTGNLELTLALADNTMNQGQTLPLEMMNNPKQAYTGPDWVDNQMTFINLKGSDFLSDTKLIEGNVYYRLSDAQSFNSNASVNVGGGNTGSGAMTGNVDGSNATSNTKQNGYGASLQISLLDDLMGHGNKFTSGVSLDFSYVNFNQNTEEANLIGNQTISDGTLQDSVKFQARNYYTGLFATDNFAVNDKLNVTASARYNVAYVNLSGLDNNIAGSALNSLDGAHTYTRINPAIGFTYNPVKSLNLYGGYNEGMRAPNSLELECSNQYNPCTLPVGFTADPDLKAVVSKTWEGGVRGNLNSIWKWNAGVFNTNTYNDIQYEYSQSTTSGYFNNVGTTQRRGIELGLNGKLDKLTLSARYSYVDATYQSAFQMGTNSLVTNTGVSGVEQINKGNQLPGISRNTLKLRLAYDVTSQWNAGANLVLAGSQWAHGDEFNLDPTGRVPGYGYLNLDTHFKINQSWQAFAKVDNVFDKQYSTFGILNQSVYTGDSQLFVTPSLPRAAWVGITYNFGGEKKSSNIDSD